MAKFTVDQWSDEGSNDESPYWIIWGEDGNSKKYVYDAVVGETLMYHNDIIAAQALEIERLRGHLDHAVSILEGIYVPLGHWDDIKELRASLQSNDAIIPDLSQFHKDHCNVGEYEGSCKYGDDDCPEL